MLRRLGLYSISTAAPLNISFLLVALIDAASVHADMNHVLSCDLLDQTRSWIPLPIKTPFTYRPPNAHRLSVRVSFVRSDPVTNFLSVTNIHCTVCVCAHLNGSSGSSNFITPHLTKNIALVCLRSHLMMTLTPSIIKVNGSVNHPRSLSSETVIVPFPLRTMIFWLGTL